MYQFPICLILIIKALLGVKNPAISVMMPVFNAQNYLPQALESVLNQSYQNFELIVFDDASTDNSKLILKHYAQKDKRIRLLELKKNRGYVYCLNQCLQLARGKYLARMDADDFCHPHRFKRQVSFLEQNPQVAVCGTDYRYVINGEKVHRVHLPHRPGQLKAALIFGNPLAHPSVMFRRSVVSRTKNFYDPKMMPAEDYDVWVRLSQSVSMVNINRPLLYYRVHAQQQTHLRAKLGMRQRAKVWHKLFKAWGVPITQKQLVFHQTLCERQGHFTSGRLVLVNAWFKQLLRWNLDAKHAYAVPRDFEKILALEWVKLLRHCTQQKQNVSQMLFLNFWIAKLDWNFQNIKMMVKILLSARFNP